MGPIPFEAWRFILDFVSDWLPLLGCGAMMFVCARLMGKGHVDSPENGLESQQQSLLREVASLQGEVARLRAKRSPAGREGEIDG